MIQKSLSETLLLSPHFGSRGKRFRTDSGSAAVEFVLMLVPLMLLLQVIMFVLAKGQIDAVAVTQATYLAQVCSLADADASGLKSASDSTTPSWAIVSGLHCEKESGFAKVRLRLSLRGFPNINREVAWHAPLETVI